jgi:phosphoribosylformylglycinamidine cyclo-ligase
MYQVFNMGIGMVLVVSKSRASEVLSQTKGKVIGQITAGSGKVRLG